MVATRVCCFRFGLRGDGEDVGAAPVPGVRGSAAKEAPTMQRRPTSSRAPVVPSTGAAKVYGGTFTHALYPALYGETMESSRRGVNGPVFARGMCGGGNANGGAFRAETPRGGGRPDTARMTRSMPRLDNLGNVGYLVPEKTQRQSSMRSSPWGQGPDFGARLVAPGAYRPGTGTARRPGTALPTSRGSTGSAPSRYAQAHHSMGDFRAVSRVGTPFTTWKSGTAALPRNSFQTNPGESPLKVEGRSENGSPLHFYSDAGCTKMEGPNRPNSIFNPLASR